MNLKRLISTFFVQSTAILWLPSVFAFLALTSPLAASSLTCEDLLSKSIKTYPRILARSFRLLQEEERSPYDLNYHLSTSNSLLTGNLSETTYPRTIPPRTQKALPKNIKRTKKETGNSPYNPLESEEPRVGLGLNYVLNAYVESGQLPANEIAFRVVFDQYEAHTLYSTHVLTLGAHRTYTPEDFKNVPLEMRPTKSFRDYSIKGFARLVFRNQYRYHGQHQATSLNYRLPVENDAGKALFDSAEFQKYDQIIEVSRFALDSSNKIDSLQHYTNVYNALFSAIDKNNLGRVLIIATAHKESVATNNERQWGFTTLPGLEAVPLTYGGTAKVMAITAEKLFSALDNQLQRQFEVITKNELQNIEKQRSEITQAFIRNLKNQDFYTFIYKEDVLSSSKPKKLKIRIDENLELQVEFTDSSGQVYHGIVTKKRITQITPAFSDTGYTYALRLDMEFALNTPKGIVTGNVSQDLQLYNGQAIIVKKPNETRPKLVEFNSHVDTEIPTYKKDGSTVTWYFPVRNKIMAPMAFPFRLELLNEYPNYFKDENSFLQFAGHPKISSQALHEQYVEHYLNYEADFQKRMGRPILKSPFRPELNINFGLFNSNEGRFDLSINAIALTEGTNRNGANYTTVPSITQLLPVWSAFERAPAWQDIFGALGFEINKP